MWHFDVHGKINAIKTQKNRNFYEKLGKLGQGKKTRNIRIAGQPACSYCLACHDRCVILTGFAGGIGQWNLVELNPLGVAYLLCKDVK